MLRDEDYLEALPLTASFKDVDELDALHTAGCKPFAGFDKECLGGDGLSRNTALLDAFNAIATDHLDKLTPPKGALRLFDPGARPDVRVVEIVSLIHPARWWGFFPGGDVDLTPLLDTYNKISKRKCRDPIAVTYG